MAKRKNLLANYRTMDLVLSLAFHGGKFNGWQSQGSAAGLRTVETTVGNAVASALGTDSAPLTAVSRLDSGVHAHCFLCRTRISVLPSTTSALDIARAVQARLPAKDAPILIRAARLCRPSQVLLRRAVGGKQYSYYVRTGQFTAGSDLGLHSVTQYMGGPLDVSAMALAATYLIGTHDFLPFASGLVSAAKKRTLPRKAAAQQAVAQEAQDGIDCEGDDSDNVSDSPSASVYIPRASKGTVRSVHSADVLLMSLEDTATYLTDLRAGPPPPELGRHVDPGQGVPQASSTVYGDHEECVVRLRFTGDGFLRHQVRHMAAALVAVGSGKIPASSVRDALAEAVPEAVGVGAHGTGSGQGHASQAEYPSAPQRWPVLPSRGLWLDESFLRGAGLTEGGRTDAPGSHFWVDNDWCNNPSPTFPAEHGIPASSWHPIE